MFIAHLVHYSHQCSENVTGHPDRSQSRDTKILQQPIIIVDKEKWEDFLDIVKSKLWKEKVEMPYEHTSGYRLVLDHGLCLDPSVYVHVVPVCTVKDQFVLASQSWRERHADVKQSGDGKLYC